MWTDKHAPTGLHEVVGNQGAIKGLFEWLRDWDDVVIQGNKKEIGKVKGRWGNP